MELANKKREKAVAKDLLTRDDRWTAGVYTGEELNSTYSTRNIL
jgi:hypothetical protein